MTTDDTNRYDVVIVGGGPSGLAAAIAARQAGLSYTVFEKGALVNTVFNYPTHMVFFTTPELLEIGDLPFVTPYEKPTRFEALRYYRKVVDHFGLVVRDRTRVDAVDRVGDGADYRFRVAFTTRDGTAETVDSRFVVLATGAFDEPNLLGIPGEDLPHVSHYYREAHPYYRKRVVVVGGKNSAAEAALDLHRSGAHVTLVHRGPTFGDGVKYWVLPDIQNRIKEGSVVARFETTVSAISPTAVTVEHDGATDEISADAVLLLTGYHSDAALFARCGVTFDPSTYQPTYDAATLETNVPRLYLVGAVVTGRNSGKIFIENGRFHGQQVIASIVDRLHA